MPVFTSTSTSHSNIYHPEFALIAEDGTQEASDQQEGTQVASPRAHQGIQAVGIQEAYQREAFQVAIHLQVGIQGAFQGEDRGRRQGIQEGVEHTPSVEQPSRREHQHQGASLFRRPYPYQDQESNWAPLFALEEDLRQRRRQ